MNTSAHTLVTYLKRNPTKLDLFNQIVFNPGIRQTILIAARSSQTRESHRRMVVTLETLGLVKHETDTTSVGHPNRWYPTELGNDIARIVFHVRN